MQKFFILLLEFIVVFFVSSFVILFRRKNEIFSLRRAFLSGERNILFKVLLIEFIFLIAVVTMLFIFSFLLKLNQLMILVGNMAIILVSLAYVMMVIWKIRS